MMHKCVYHDSLSSVPKLVNKQYTRLWTQCVYVAHHLFILTASLFLIYMDTLMRQIFDIVQKEKRKQAWVPIAREVWSLSQILIIKL